MLLRLFGASTNRVHDPLLIAGRELARFHIFSSHPTDAANACKTFSAQDIDDGSVFTKGLYAALQPPLELRTSLEPPFRSDAPRRTLVVLLRRDCFGKRGGGEPQALPRWVGQEQGITHV